jgi:hypothetical protein
MVSLICGLYNWNKCSNIFGHGSQTKRRQPERNTEREGNLKLKWGWCAHCRGASIIILTWQRPLCQGDQEEVKRSGRNELMWVAIHMCMEATLGISLYRYFLSQTSKNSVFHIITMFSLQQNQRIRR